jgi:hypothetical protein
LSFAPGDVGEIREGENINIIRDAVVFIGLINIGTFSFGQTKLPGIASKLFRSITVNRSLY